MQEVRNLVNEFQDVFTDKPGFTDLLGHEIKTTTDTPIRLKQYLLPFTMTDKVSDEIENDARNVSYQTLREGIFIPNSASKEKRSNSQIVHCP